jgi:hypothetical protein
MTVCDAGPLMTLWRPISFSEIAMVTAILERSAIPAGRLLLHGLGQAHVLPDTVWFYEMRTPGNGRIKLPNGPFPAFAYVRTGSEYRGEILLWLKDGRLSALEYAWVSDDLPTRWPRPDELDVVSQIEEPK